jgi:hypothetical protein
MLRFVTQRSWPRKERLFACACGWQVVCHLTNPLVLAALYVAERFADNLAGMDEVVCAFDAAHQAGNESEGVPARSAALVSLALGEGNNLALEAWEDLIDLTPVEARPARRAWGAQVARCIWGPLPFCQVTLDDSWITAEGLLLSRGMYESRDFAAMPLLADALEEAGCDSADVLAHCRGLGAHARGCWVVDLPLAKE